MAKETGEKVRDLDFKKIQIQLITRIRGQKSQQQLNHQLGYEFNKLAKWENGTNKISWQEFLELITYQRIDISSYFLKSFNYNADLKDTSSLIFHIVGQIPSDSLASSLGVSRSKIYRMFSSEAPCYLEDILKVIFLADNYFLDLIRILVGEEPLDELKAFHAHLENQDIFFNFPETSFILGCMELHEYALLEKHDNSFIAKKTHINENKILEIISLLETHGMIEKNNNKYYVLAKTTMLEKGEENIWKNKLFWLKRYQELTSSRIDDFEKQQNNLGKYGYAVTVLTPSAKKAIEQQISRFYQEVTTILSSDLNRTSDDLKTKREDICLFHLGITSLLKK